MLFLQPNPNSQKSNYKPCDCGLGPIYFEVRTVVISSPARKIGSEFFRLSGAYPSIRLFVPGNKCCVSGIECPADPTKTCLFITYLLCTSYVLLLTRDSPLR